MGGIGLATSHSIRPLLPLSLKFEQGTRAQAWSYTHGRTLHRPGYGGTPGYFYIIRHLLIFLYNFALQCNIG